MERALEKIADAKKNRATELNLSFERLTKLPDALFELVWLDKLNLSSNKLTDDSLAALAQLPHLVELNLNNNKITDLGVAILSRMTQLTSLDLVSNPITKESIPILAKMPFLKGIGFEKNQITKDDFDTISEWSQLTLLDLSNNQLTDISALQKMEQLQALVLSDNQLTDISALQKMEKLQALYLSNNQLTDSSALQKMHSLKILDLSNNQLTDISALQKMDHLQSLGLSNNQLTDISALPKMDHLQYLDLSNNQLTDISVLQKMEQLQILVLSNNKLTNISALQKMYNLWQLDLSNNQLTDISALPKMEALRNLELSNTLVEDLSPIQHLIEKNELYWDIYDEKANKTGIYVKNCPLICPFPEIVQNGTESVREYFDAIAQSGASTLGKLRLLLVGEGESGKTTLQKKFKNETYPVPNLADKLTMGIKIQHLNDWLPDTQIHCWDFGGQEIQYYTHQIFLSPRSVYVLVANARSQNPNFKYWLQILETLAVGSPVFVLYNLRDALPLPASTSLESWRERFPALDLRGAYKLNLADNQLKKFRAFKNDLSEQLAEIAHLRYQFPNSWLDVQQKIEIEAETKDYIDQARFYEITQPLQPQNADILTDYFHATGLLLRFRDDAVLQDFIVLRPQWAIDALYKLLEHPDLEQQNGLFDKKTAIALLVKDKKSPTVAQLLLQLMGKDGFNICFNVSNTQFIAPQLLPDDPLPNVSVGALAIRFRLDYTFLPKGTFVRFCVQNHEDIPLPQTKHIRQNAVWLESDECKARVRQFDYPDKGYLTLEIFGDTHNAKKYLHQLRKSCQRVNKLWQKVVTENLYCHCAKCQNSADPILFSLKSLQDRLIENGANATAECGKSYKPIPVVPLLETVFAKEEVQKWLPKPKFEFHKIRELLAKDRLEAAAAYLSEYGNIEENLLISVKAQMAYEENQYLAGTKTHDAQMRSSFREKLLRLAEQCK